MKIQNIQDHLQAICDEQEMSDLLIEDVIDAILWFGCNPIEVSKSFCGKHISVRMRDNELVAHWFFVTPKPTIDYLKITRESLGW